MPIRVRPARAAAIGCTFILLVFGVACRSPLARTVVFRETVASSQATTDRTASGLVPPRGGTITLPGYATLLFLEGSFPAGETVSISATSRRDTAEEFRATAELLSAGPRLPYEIRITTGARPQSPTPATLVVPKKFSSQLNPGARIRMFAQIFQDGGNDILDSFELLPSTVSVTLDSVSAPIPPEAFASRRRRDGIFEAILIVAATPGTAK